MPQQLHQQPRGVAARARRLRQRLFRRLHARLQADQIARRRARSRCVQLDEKVDRATRLARDRRQVVPRSAASPARVTKYGASSRELAALVVERKFSAYGSRKKSNGLSTAISATRSTSIAQLRGLLREHQPREIVRLRILLPVDEVLGRRDLQRVGQDARAAVRRGTQAHDLGLNVTRRSYL